MKKTKQEFINDATSVHGTKYIYDLVVYESTHKKVKIICPKHGEFLQTPVCHVSLRQGCPVCGGTGKNTTEKFIAKAKAIHGEKYNYSLVDYKNNNTIVKIICPEHGVFNQLPRNHVVGGAGCPTCSGRKRFNTNEFIEHSTQIHGERYDYSLVKYKNATTKVKIICPIHGIWEVTPTSHIHSKTGCPSCCLSRGEQEIKDYLTKHKITYVSQYAPPGLHFTSSKKSHLRFDFFLPEHNILIEFDGEQHNKFIKRYHKSLKGFQTQQKRDEKKNRYALENQILLIRIPYKQQLQIPEILTKYLFHFT